MKNTVKNVFIGLGALVLIIALLYGRHIAGNFLLEQACDEAREGKDPSSKLAQCVQLLSDDDSQLDHLQQRLSGEANRLSEAGKFKEATIFLIAAIPVEEEVWGKGNDLVRMLYVQLVDAAINAGSYDTAQTYLEKSLHDTAGEERKRRPGDDMYKPEKPMYQANRILAAGELMEYKGEKPRAERLYRAGLTLAKDAQSQTNQDQFSDYEKRGALWILARAEADLGKFLSDRAAGAFAANVADTLDGPALLKQADETAKTAAAFKIAGPGAMIDNLPDIDSLETALGRNYKPAKDRVEKLLGTTYEAPTN